MKNTLLRRSFATRTRMVLSTLIQPAVLGLLIAHAQAGNTWTGGGASNNWSDNNNWGGSAPGYGTLTFTTGGAQGTTSFNNSISAQNSLLWTGSSSWTLNGSTTLSLFDFGGAQAKIENQSTGSVTINDAITFAANNGAPPNPFGEINAVNGNITFGTGTLTVNGSSVNGIKLFGSNHTATFNNTVSAAGKWFGLTAANTTMAVGGAFTSGDIYVMNGGSLKLNSGGSITTSALRLGGDFGNTGNQNQTLGGTLQFTNLTGGQSFSGVINTVTGNTSNALLIDSLNTSGTNTLTGASFLDADLKTQVAAGGTLSFTGGSVDVKIRKLTVGGSGITVINEPLTSSFAAGGFLVKEGAGTLVLQGTANTYTGTSNATLNANGTQLSGGTLGIHGDGSLGLAPTGGYNNIQFLDNATLQDTANNISLNANRNISIASGKTATFDSNGNTFTINGILNGSGGIVAKTGAGTVVLTNAGNSYTGATNITQGTLQVNVNNALGTNAGGTVVSSGAALSLNGVNYSTAEALQIDGTGVGGSGSLVNSGTSTYAGQITAATNSLISAGGGTLTLTGGIVKNGTTVTLYGGPSGGGFNINTVGISGAAANSDLIVNNAAVALNVASTYNGPTYIRNAGTLTANVSNALPTAPRSAVFLDDIGGGSSTLGLASGVSNAVASLTGASSSFVGLTGTSSLTVGTGSGNTIFAGTLLGLGSLVKDGASTQILTGDSNAFSGTTTVSAGVLEANNTSGSATGAGDVTVGASGTLAGTGRVAPGANKFITIGGKIEVGDVTLGSPVGSLLQLATSGSGSTLLNGGSLLKLDLITGAGLGDNSSLSSAADRLKISGNLNIASGAFLQIANPNALTGWAAGDRWRVFDWSSVGTITGSYAPLDITLPTLGAGLTWDTSNLYTTSGAFSGTIDIEAVPEPGSVIFGIFCALSATMRRRRRQA